MSELQQIRASRLRQRMLELGKDQDDLASQVGVTQGTISLILTGKTRNSRHIGPIASALRVNMAWLIGDTDIQIEMLDLDGQPIEESDLPRLFQDPSFKKARVMKTPRATEEMAEYERAVREELEWVELLNGIPAKDRGALLQLARTIAHSAQTPMMQSQRQEFRR